MRARAWFIQPQPACGDLPRTVHLTVQPASLATVEEFVADLADGRGGVRGTPWAAADPALAGAAAGIDVGALDDATVAGLLAPGRTDRRGRPRSPGGVRRRSRR